MAGERKKEGVQVILRFFEAFNKRDVKTMMKLLDEEHVDHTYFGHGPVRPEAVGRAIQGMWKAFPDWQETVDEIVAGDDEETFIVRQTGHGTQVEPYMGKPPTGKQIAAHLITTLVIRKGKIKEYRSTFPFATPFDEQIVASRDLQETRAEQGGLLVDEDQWRAALEEFAEGRVDREGLKERKARAVTEVGRCQTLLAESMRRCANPVVPGSIYCSIHQEPGQAGAFGA